mgnify:CR=1 FL=1
MRKVSVGKHLTAGGSDLFYTVPKGYRASWVLLYAINNTASAKNLTVVWYDSSAATSIHVFNAYPLSAKAYLMFDSGAWAMLEEGDTVTISIEAGADADAICSFELERNNNE